MQAIDNVAHAIGQAREERLNLSHLAVTAWRRAELAPLQTAIVQALGIRGSFFAELTVDDVISDAIVGTVVELVHRYSHDNRHLMDLEDQRGIEEEYLDLVVRVANTQSGKFLSMVRRQVRAAMALSLTARLDCTTLEQRYARTPLASSLSFVLEVDQYFRDYKRQCGLLDVADVLVSELEPIDGCALLLLNPVGMPPLALPALRRLLPRAFFCWTRL